MAAKTEVLTFDEDIITGDVDQMTADLYLSPQEAAEVKKAQLSKFGLFVLLGYLAYYFTRDKA